MIRSIGVVFLSLWLCTACDGSSAERNALSEDDDVPSSIDGDSQSEPLQLAQIEPQHLGDDEHTPYPVAVHLGLNGVPGSDYELSVNQTLLQKGQLPRRENQKRGRAKVDAIVILNNAEDHLFYLEMNTPEQGRADDFRVVSVKPRQCMDDKKFFNRHIQESLETDCAACHSGQDNNGWRTDRGLAGIRAYILNGNGQKMIWHATRNGHGKDQDVGAIWSPQDTELLRMAELVYRAESDFRCEEEDLSANFERGPTFYF